MTRGGASPKRSGSDFERAVKKTMEGEGWLVIRSPASLSEIDLLCVKPNPPEIMLLQCKQYSPYLPPKQRAALADLVRRDFTVYVVHRGKKFSREIKFVPARTICEKELS